MELRCFTHTSARGPSKSFSDDLVRLDSQHASPPEWTNGPLHELRRAHIRVRVAPWEARAKVLGTYSGLRPATEHRDYQIHARDGEQWITVGGIRSTGLTGSSGIGEYVAGLYLGLSPALLRTVHGDAVSPPYASTPLYPVGQTNATVANLETLAADFQAHGDGTVEIYGRRHRVTHPLTAFGLASMRPVPQGPASTAAGQRT